MHKLVRRPAGSPPDAPSMYQPACKPGSVRAAARTADVTAIPLARRLPGASCNLPERLIRTDPDSPACAKERPRRSYSVLLPVGFAVPPPLPEARCALTAPFHPYRGCYATRRGGLFSVALSLRSNPASRGLFPRRTLSGTVCPWSPDFPLRPPFGIGAERPSGRLTG
jgi:hypothetical protein